MRSRKGTYIVEATMIYPIIVVVTVMLIAISLYIYNCCAAYSDMSRDMKRLAGFEAGTVTYSDTDEFGGEGDYDVSVENGLLSKKYAAVIDTEYRNNFVIKTDHMASFSFKSDVLNEAGLIWDEEFAKDMAGL